MVRMPSDSGATQRVRPLSARRVGGDFYLRSAADCATDFLGKVLVRRTPAGPVAGMIRDVESYPAFVDEVHHGSKRTPRTAVIRGVVPVEGIETMAAQWDKPRAAEDLANSPGKLCKSFQITRNLYGADLTGDELFLEDWGIPVDPTDIRTTKRVGISARHDGHDAPLRYHLARN